MAEYSESDTIEAERIIQSLINSGAEGGRSLERDLETADNLVISDIESDTNEFLDDLRLLEYANRSQIPGLRIETGELIPIALSYLFGDAIPLSSNRNYHYDPFYLDRLHYYLDDYFRIYRYRDSGNDFGVLTLNEARSTFRKRAIDFLATRISGVNGKSDNSNGGNSSFLNLFKRSGGAGPKVMTPGCSFSVTTNTKGLSVYWSGGYRITKNNFAHPTSPATSTLQSGVYVFGVGGGAYKGVQWDDALVSLPGDPSIHLNY